MSEPEYRRITKDLTLTVAGLLARLALGMAFVYVSGSGTDSTEHGRLMWARVKGQTENALLRLPFKAVYLFRPAYIQPVHGVTSRTRWMRVLYRALGPFFPVWRTLFPRWVTTTEQVGKAMLVAALRGAPSRWWRIRTSTRWPGSEAPGPCWRRCSPAHDDETHRCQAPGVSRLRLQW